MLQRFRPLAHWLEHIFHLILFPPPAARVRGTLADLTYSKGARIAENALRRQQLALLHRQGKRPHLHRRKRFGLLLLARRVRNWKDALLILKPDTRLCWHRKGFRLFGRWKTRTNSKPTGLAAETSARIPQLARANLPWGAERIRRQRSLQ